MGRSPYTIKTWLVAEVERRKREGTIAPTASMFARELAAKMQQDAQCPRAIPATSVRVRLYDWKLWEDR